MARTHNIIQKHADKSKSRQKDYYDRKTKAVKISIGDRVLVKQLAFEGKHKLADKYEPGTCIMEDQPRPDIPVQKVKSEISGRERTLHQNHLLKIEYQGTAEEVDDISTKRIGEEVTVSEEMEKPKVIEDASQEEDTVKEKPHPDVIRATDETSDKDDDSEDEMVDSFAAKALRDGDANDPIMISKKKDEEVYLVEVGDDEEIETVRDDTVNTLDAQVDIVVSIPDVRDAYTPMEVRDDELSTESAGSGIEVLSYEDKEPEVSDETIEGGMVDETKEHQRGRGT